MKSLLIPIIVAFALMMAGCHQAASETAEDAVAAIQASADKSSDARAEAMIAAAMADYEVAATAAYGRYGVDEEKCDAFEGADKRDCIIAADIALSVARAEAVERRNAILVQAEPR